MKRLIVCEPVNRKIAQPKNIKDFKTISFKAESLKKVVLLIACITIMVNPIINITTALCNIKDTNCSKTADLLCLLPTDVANIIGLIKNKNRNSI